MEFISGRVFFRGSFAPKAWNGSELKVTPLSLQPLEQAGHA